MKVALCLSGIVGGVEGKGGRGTDTDYVVCSKLLKEFVIEPNDCDVFIHSWSVEHKENLVELYKPKSYIFEPQIDFSINPNRNKSNYQSKWYSIIQSLLQVVRFGEYDWVIITRFDIMFLQNLNLSEFDSNYLYMPNYSVYPKNTNRERWEIPPKNNQSLKRRVLHDMYIIASYTNTLKLAFNEPQNWFYNSSVNPHKANRARVINIFGNISDVVRFWGYRGYEWDLYRWKICHSKS